MRVCYFEASEPFLTPTPALTSTHNTITTIGWDGRGHATTLSVAAGGSSTSLHLDVFI